MNELRRAHAPGVVRPAPLEAVLVVFPLRRRETRIEANVVEVKSGTAWSEIVDWSAAGPL